MFKRLFFILLVASASIFLMNCSDDEEANPVNSDLIDFPVTINGITQTDDLGNVVGGDMTDWCYSQTKNSMSEIPTEYALYPAYPNASYYNFAIIYDLPAQSNVQIYVINTTSIVRTLVTQTQDAGRYITGWNILDNAGTRVDTGLYQVLMMAGDFICSGDIRVLPVPQPDSGSLIVYTKTLEDDLAVSYDSPSKVAAIWLKFIFNGSVGNPMYDSVAWDMNLISHIAESSSAEEPDTLKVLIVSPVDQLTSMPSGLHDLCRIPVLSGAVSLDYVEASDDLGALIPVAIMKLP